MMVKPCKKGLVNELAIAGIFTVGTSNTGHYRDMDRPIPASGKIVLTTRSHEGTGMRHHACTMACLELAVESNDTQLQVRKK